MERNSHSDSCRTEEQDVLFRLLVESVQDYAIFALDPQGHVISWNAGAMRLNGYEADEIVGQHFSCFYPPNVVAQGKPENDLRIARVQGRLEDENWRIRKDGSRFWANVVITALLDPSGELRGFAKVIRDFTERKAAEDKIERLNAELTAGMARMTAANAGLESFCYSVSHDLRAPLRAIEGFSRILLQQHAASLNAEGQEFLQDIRANALQMGRLIDDLLGFSRLSCQAIKKQSIDPGEIVQACIDELENEREGRQVEFQVSEIPRCYADRSLLKQTWFNLISNALKYTGKRSSAVIQIGSHCGSSGETVFFVKDNGVGFNMAYAGKLFEVFQRLHRAEEFDGTGVGLAIAKRIVQRHGGRIWADSQPDRGAEFFFTLEAPSDS